MKKKGKINKKRIKKIPKRQIKFDSSDKEITSSDNANDTNKNLINNEKEEKQQVETLISEMENYEIDINSIDVILDESKIEARSKINIETCFLNDSSNIYSPKISINNNHLLEQENSYSELKNARINLY